jgi:exopolysaccharide biosynthesis protein
MPTVGIPLLFLFVVLSRVGVSKILDLADSASSPRIPKFDLVVVPTFNTSRSETNITQVNSSDLPRIGYVVVTTDTWSVVVPHQVSSSRKSKLKPTSEQAKQHHCFLATNGGPYHEDGTCTGAVIVNGDTVIDRFDGVGFGITRKPSKMWVIGSVASAEQAATLGLQHYVTGFDWLVYSGKSVATERNNTTGASQAPRTAVGVDAVGRLMLLVADGCQNW